MAPVRLNRKQTVYLQLSKTLEQVIILCHPVSFEIELGMLLFPCYVCVQLFSCTLILCAGTAVKGAEIN